MHFPIFHIDSHDPHLTLTHKAPANCTHVVDYAKATHWRHTDFSIVQQYHDARHMYLHLLEIHARVPLNITISCSKPDLYWLYQLEGNSCLIANTEPHKALHLHTDEYRLAYAPSGEYRLSVKPGKHLLFFFMIKARLLLRYAQRDFKAILPLLTALDRQQQDCLTSRILPIHDQIRQHLLQLVGLSTSEGMTLDARVYTPIAALAKISQQDLGEHDENDERSLQLVTAVRQYIQTQVREGAVSPITEIVQHFHVSYQYLGRAHQKHYGSSVQQYIIKKKVEEAMRLLKEEGYNATQITYRLGYQERKSFYKQFKKVYGISPGEVKQKGDGLDLT